jgi:glucan biosynthesis protein
VNKEEQFWKKNADNHIGEIFRMLCLYFRGHVPMQSVETALKKAVSDTALYTNESVKIDMEKLKLLIENLKIAVPKNLQEWREKP